MKKLIAILLSLSFLFSSTFAAAEDSKVNINTADVTALSSQLDGIGPKKAQAIIDFRTENGPFNSVDDLTLVSGIGPKLLERNRDLIIVAEQPVITETSNAEAINTTDVSNNNTVVEKKHITTTVKESVTDEDVETKVENQASAMANSTTKFSTEQTKSTQ